MSCRRLDLCFGAIAWPGMLLNGFILVVLDELLEDELELDELDEQLGE